MPSFRKVIGQLEKQYGRPKPPRIRDPFELILYENIAYLVSDDRREKAFRELKMRVGLRVADILTAPMDKLTEITAMGGIFPELRARRLQESARLVRDEFGGSLRSALALDPPAARRALKKFPTIGDPGADKIPLVHGDGPSLAPESNGLRVLMRLGLVKEHKNYATM
jgi:endonuclease-3